MDVFDIRVLLFILYFSVFRGQIVQAQAVDGVWSEWSEYTACSATCDGGTMTRNRTCTNPAPSGGGNNCTGDDTQCAVCNNLQTEWCTHCSGRAFDMSGAAVNPNHDVDSQTAANISAQVDPTTTGYIVFVRDTRLRIRCCGRISHWEFNATKTGTIRFLVGKQESNWIYTLIGENVVTVDASMINQMYKYEVPENERITVVEGYRIGWYSTDFDVINYVNCPNTNNNECSTGIWDWLRCPKNNIIMPSNVTTVSNQMTFDIAYKIPNYAFDIVLHFADNPPPSFTSTGISISISDQTAVGSTLFNATFSDTDTVTFSLNYTISPYFSIDTNIGTVSINSTLPHVTNGSGTTIHELLIMGEDTCYNVVTGTATVTTYNDAPVVHHSATTADLAYNETSRVHLSDFNVTDISNDVINCTISDVSPAWYTSYFDIEALPSNSFAIYKIDNISVGSHCSETTAQLNIDCTDQVTIVTTTLALSVQQPSDSAVCSSSSISPDTSDSTSNLLVPIAVSLSVITGVAIISIVMWSCIKSAKSRSQTPVKKITDKKILEQNAISSSSSSKAHTKGHSRSLIYPEKPALYKS